jgi:hypothetical protein
MFCFDNYFSGKIWLCCLFQIHHQIQNAHLKNFKYDQENLGPAAPMAYWARPVRSQSIFCPRGQRDKQKFQRHHGSKWHRS